MRRNTTIEDIARRAGFSVTTVSRVLNNVSKKYRISEKTQNLILRTSKSLHYRPNQLARSLRLRKTHTLGLIVPDIANPFFAAITDTIQMAARKLGYSLVVCNTDDTLDLEVEQTNLLLSKGVDGLIILPVGQQSEHLRKIRREKIPFVLVDRTFDALHVPSVVVNNSLGAHQAVKHLLDRGHRRIGIIEGIPNTYTTIERRKGYISALKEVGIKPDPQLMRGSSFRRETGYTETKNLLALEEPPTAIFATNDLITMGVLEAIYEKGLSIPQDISMVAFDEIDFNDFLRCPLTVIAQPKERLGEIAVEMLMDEMKQPVRPVRQTVLPPMLVEGSSVRTLHQKQSHATLRAG